MHGVRACTDVTGFGLLGHLTEMTRASSVGARLALESVPALPGAVQSLAQGHVSSLHAGNRSVEALIACPDHLAGDPRLHLLFDPQTSGGLIAGVPPDRVQACLAALHAQGYHRAAVVGEVVGLDHDVPPIRLV